MTPMQLKMARVALGITVRQAAETCGVSHDTITRIEAGQDLKGTTVAKVRDALEAAGVEFIPENGGGPGVRLKKRVSMPDHPRPSGAATDVVDTVDKAISKDRARLASVKETGEEVPQEEWERFEAANKKPKSKID